MLMSLIVNIFVYVPAIMFYFLIGFYAWTQACEKKNRERHEDDGK